ncbi:MAG: carbohydrate ABC transporter permease [Candidatus Nitrospinota bacterium M3_3B_026]
MSFPRLKPQTAYLAPAGLALAAVTLYPLVYVAWLSLRRYQLTLGESGFTGLENYRRLFEDARFWNALYNTAYFTAVSVALELALGLSLAILLNRVFAGKGLMRAVVMIPWAIPTVVSARMWEWMYNADFGVLNYLLGADVNWLGAPFWAMNAAIIMEVWKTTPFVTLLLMAGLAGMPEDLYRAARVDGASPWMTFRRITLPLLSPLILVTLIFRAIDAFRVFDSIYVLTGGGPANSTETLSIYAYKTLFQTLQFGYGSAISVTVFMLVGLITLSCARLLRRM